MKILVIRFSSIGDIVLTSPVLRCIKTQFPEIELHFLTKASMREVVEHNPYIDKLFLWSKENEAFLLKTMREEGYACAIDLHHNLRTWKLRMQLGLEMHRFDKLNIEKWLLVRLKWNRLPKVHIVQRYLQAASAIGIKDDGKGLDYFLPKDIETKGASFSALKAQPYIAFAIGAQHFTKRIPKTLILSWCRQLPYPIVFLGGKEDKMLGDALQQQLETENIISYNLAGTCSLAVSAWFIRDAAFVLTPDTGLMHIAAAFNKTIYSVWGNTVPEFGMYPYRTEHRIIEVQGLSCRPCSKIGFQHCPKGHFKCMEQEQDWGKIERLPVR